MDPQQNQSQAPMPAPEKKSVGPLVGIIIIIIVIILGGIYFWKGMPAGQENSPATEGSASTTASSEPSTADLDKIQADLNSSNDTSVDFSDVESQLNQ